MKFKKQVFVESAVGLFSFAVIAALFMFTVVLSRDAFFRASQPIEVVFENAMGLRVGDIVSARGVTVGKVTQIQLRKDGVHVLARLDVPVTLWADYRIEVMSSSVLGGRYLSIQEGSHAGEEISTKQALKGSPSPNLIDSATRAVEDIRQALNDGILEDFKVTMAQVRKIATRLGEGEGTLGKLINDDAVYGDVQQVAANLRQISDQIAKGEGTIGKLVNDEQLYTDAQGVAANLKEISDRLAKGEGTLGKLLSEDDQVYQDLAATLASFRKMSASIERGEGTLGKLVSDESLYLEFESLLREGRAAVDDMRETSPITTFTSIFFGAF
jgi:phospholipid/cholesterol/gamma-HCH transport system substrate-binding protein